MPDDQLEYQGEPWIRDLGPTHGQTFRCEHMEFIGVMAATCPTCGPLDPDPQEPTP